MKLYNPWLNCFSQFGAFVIKFEIKGRDKMTFEKMNKK